MSANNAAIFPWHCTVCEAKGKLAVLITEPHERIFDRARDLHRAASPQCSATEFRICPATDTFGAQIEVRHAR